MTATRRAPLLVRAGSAAALVLALAGCTPGGQFDPTSLLANDMFDTKTKLKGDRQPVFPNGVPGASSGVPQDLVKGYQPPPDQAADTSAPDAAAQAAQEAAKNKPKPKPKVARAPAQPPAPPPRRINIGASPNPAAPAAPQGAAPAPQQPQQSAFPPPPPTAPAQQANPTVESRWPDPPKPGTSSQ